MYQKKDIKEYQSITKMNTKNSTIYGKAYEYACLMALKEQLIARRPVHIEDNSTLAIARTYYEEEIPFEVKTDMQKSAFSGVQAIITMEPNLHEGTDLLLIKLQPDTIATRFGDIRDVIIVRNTIHWEIGISVKHNHAALKHSRLSPSLDFGKVWFNKPCSASYFHEIGIVFDKIQHYKEQNYKWSEIAEKEKTIYLPLLEAFKKELLSLNEQDSVTTELIQYLLGSNGKDYYKSITPLIRLISFLLTCLEH